MSHLWINLNDCCLSRLSEFTLTPLRSDIECRNILTIVVNYLSKIRLVITLSPWQDKIIIIVIVIIVIVCTRSTILMVCLF